MERKDWFQLWMASMALALIVAFNNCSGVDWKTEDVDPDANPVLNNVQNTVTPADNITVENIGPDEK
jgi:hypothetical protein